MTDKAQVWPKAQLYRVGTRWNVINPDGDAELGNWLVAECFWKENAERIVELWNGALRDDDTRLKAREAQAALDPTLDATRSPL
jgi:hypothetical protein